MPSAKCSISNHRPLERNYHEYILHTKNVLHSKILYSINNLLKQKLYVWHCMLIVKKSFAFQAVLRWLAPSKCFRACFEMYQRWCFKCRSRNLRDAFIFVHNFYSWNRPVRNPNIMHAAMFLWIFIMRWWFKIKGENYETI